MRFTSLGNAPQKGSVTVKSGETTITIKKGAPLFFSPAVAVAGMGFTVLSTESLAAASEGFFAGMALQDINPAKFGDGHCYGLLDYVRVQLASRAASTDVWASYSAGALGDIMRFTTIADAQCVVRSGAGSASNQFWMVQLAETYASATTQASSIGGTSLVSVSDYRCMVRAM